MEHVKWQIPAARARWASPRDPQARDAAGESTGGLPDAADRRASRTYAPRGPRPGSKPEYGRQVHDQARPWAEHHHCIGQRAAVAASGPPSGHTSVSTSLGRSCAQSDCRVPNG